MKSSITPPPQLMTLIAGMEPLFKQQGYGITVRPLIETETAQYNENKSKWLSPRSIELNYGIGRWSIYRMIRNGSLKSAKLSKAKSGKVLVDEKSLLQYLASKEFIPAPMNTIKNNKNESE
jgi:hypothetical protein